MTTNGIPPPARETDDGIAAPGFTALDRFQRYYTANERSFYKALKELQALQTNRAQRATLAPELPADTPLLTRISAITKRTHRGTVGASLAAPALVWDASVAGGASTGRGEPRPYG